MRFGGHQTFTIRDGWLFKGLQYLISEKDRWKLVHEYAADYLGVGRNMAKSIVHWLLATGLAEKVIVTGKSGRQVTTKDVEPTELAKLIWNKDRYFLNINTWWMLHVNIVNNPDHAATWNWFFNNFHLDRFQKQVCLQALARRETLEKGRTPSTSTLERDLSCFLNSYSKDIPYQKKDPEDEIECPFVELGLVNYYRSSGYYQINRDKREINFYVFMYAIAKAIESNNLYEDQEIIEIPFFDFVGLHSGPGRVFSLTNEGMFELLLAYTDKQDVTYLKMIGLAGDRILRFGNNTPISCAKKMYATEIDHEYKYS